MISEIVIIFLLILINGIFSMAEIAFLTSKKSKLEYSAKKGNSTSAKVIEIVHSPSKMLSTIQIAITLISIILGVYSGSTISRELAALFAQIPTISPFANSLSVIIVVIVITFFSLVIGELLPKRIGHTKPEAIARLLVLPMELISKISMPFVWILSESTEFLFGTLGIKKKISENEMEEEIKSLIQEGKNIGVISEFEKGIVEQAFQLGDRKITSLMIHRNDINYLSKTATTEDIIEKISSTNMSVFPVCDGEIDSPLGLIRIKNLLKSKIINSEINIESNIEPVLFFQESASVYKVLDEFKEKKIHYAFVLNEYGTVEGYITLRKILESLINEISEDEESRFVVREDGSVLVDGTTHFYDFLKYFNLIDVITFDEKEFSTLAGYILHKMQKIPSTGDKLKIMNYEIEIIDMDFNKIDKLLVKKNTY